MGFAFSPNLKANVFEAIRLTSFLNAHIYFLHVGSSSVAKEKIFTDILVDSPVKPEKISVIWEKGEPVETIREQCKKNNIDLTQNINLVTFIARSNLFSSIDVSNNTLLTFLYLGNNQLANLDVTNNLNILDL